jgi:hypothetical protein
MKLKDDSGRGSPQGMHDESCIDESPETKANSRVMNRMGEENKKNQALSKFTNPINTTKKLRGVNSGRMDLTPVRGIKGQ